jgi:hypothetical protein
MIDVYIKGGPSLVHEWLAVFVLSVWLSQIAGTLEPKARRFSGQRCTSARLSRLDLQNSRRPAFGTEPVKMSCSNNIHMIDLWHRLCDFLTKRTWGQLTSKQ